MMKTKVCGDHGIVEGSKCVCEDGWVGEHCQYKTNCKTDDDCNGDKVNNVERWKNHTFCCLYTWAHVNVWLFFLSTLT